MVKEILSRDLGLFATVSISIGAMVGAGIFILPGFAFDLAGPAVVLAFICAGLIALTAAVSKSELATAMPTAGGAYVFISKSMGPLAGSIAGWGIWASLILKGSFALVGLSAYLAVVIILPFTSKIISLSLCIFLLILNALGSRATGKFQSVIITLVLLTLVVFIISGFPKVDMGQFTPLAPSGSFGVLAATGLVFVSYIGVTKIASVAEEIKEPEKNIPRAMFISLFVMMAIYSFVVFVLVGTYPHDELAHTYTPISSAGEIFLGHYGAVVIAIVAVIALISMANAAILSGTRYPFAMSRDQLMPKWLLSINKRFSTPHNSIIFTGVVMVAFITFFDVVSIAKLASVFTMLMFIFNHFALLILRYTHPKWYKPKYKAPLFPVVQVVGIIATFALITQMGFLSALATVILFILGLAWFFFYGKKRVSFQGAFMDAVEFDLEQKAKHIESAKFDHKEIRILIPLGKLKHEKDLLSLARWIAKGRKSITHVVQIKEVPFQTPFEVVKGTVEGTESEFEERAHEIAKLIGLNIETYEILSHDWKQSVMNFAEKNGSDLILLDWEEEFRYELVHGSDVHWIMDNAPCDVAVFKDRGFKRKGDILLITTSDVYDNTKVRMANSIGVATEATVTFFQVIDPKTNVIQRRRINKYHDMLNEKSLCESKSMVVESKNLEKEVLKEAENHSMIILSASDEASLKESIFGHVEDRIIKKVDTSILILVKVGPELLDDEEDKKKPKKGKYMWFEDGKLHWGMKSVHEGE
jgi:amino acid transporter